MSSRARQKQKRREEQQRHWDNVPWTPFEPAHPSADLPPEARPHAIYINSIYQVSVWYDHHELFGDYCHLSIKTHDKAPRHDWREMQRIKNELAYPEAEAIEIFPAESRLVDTANSYHLFVFKTFKIPLGFQDRLVGDGKTENVPGSSRQRPWRPEFRPADVVSDQDMSRMTQERLGVKVG